MIHCLYSPFTIRLIPFFVFFITPFFFLRPPMADLRDLFFSVFTARAAEQLQYFMHQVAKITKERKNYMVRHDLSKGISEVARSKNLSQSKFLEQAAEHYLKHLEWEEAEGEMSEAMRSTRKINRKLDRVSRKVENSP